MPDYLFVGESKENIPDLCGEVHLVICHDCGYVLVKNDDGAKCNCTQFIHTQNGWEAKQ